jgi:hypothetical protein
MVCNQIPLKCVGTTEVLEYATNFPMGVYIISFVHVSRRGKNSGLQCGVQVILVWTFISAVPVFGSHRSLSSADRSQGESEI